MTLYGTYSDNEISKLTFSNLEILLNLNKHSKTEDVITEVACDCLKEIKKSQLGWGHSFKKFLATTLTYASVLALPITALVGTIWYYFDQIKNLSALYDAKNIALTGSSIGTLLLADYAIGKIFGTRPITAILIAGYDAYRQGAKNLANQVRDSYINQEHEVKDLIKQSKQLIESELEAAYLAIANELAQRYNEGNLQDEMTTLKQNLPIIAESFSKIGISDSKISKILSPINQAIRLIKIHQKKLIA